MRKLFTSAKLSAIILTVLAFSISYDTFTNASNPPTGYTNAPSEGNCTSCHTGAAISSGTAWSSIAITGLPSVYVPGTNYSLTLTGSSAATAKNGFELTVLNSSNASTGTLTAGSGSTTATATRVYLRQTSSAQSSWSFNWTAPSSGAGAVTFYVSYNGSNNNGTDGSGDNIYVKTFSLTEQTANPPTASISPSFPNVCVGDTLVLTAGGLNGPTGYTWTLPGGNPSSATTKEVKVVYSSTTTQTITLVTSNGFGSSNPVMVNVTPKAKPIPTITSVNTYVCGNDSITLTANPNINGTSFQYLWSPGNQTTKTINAVAGTYTVKITATGNCSANSPQKIITQRAKPTVQIFSNKDTICSNDSIIFTFSGNATKYTFMNDAGIFTKIGNDTGVLKSSGGNYNVYVIAQDSIFCSNTSDVKMVRINFPLPLPIVSCGNKTQTSVQFNWATVLGATKYEVSLDSGGNWIAANGVNSLSHTVTGLQVNQNVKIWVRAFEKFCGGGNPAIFTCQSANCQRLPIVISADTKACVSDSGKYNLNVSVPNNGKKYAVIIDNTAPINPGNYTFKLGRNPTTFNIPVKVIDSSDLNCPFDTLLVITNYDAPKGLVEIVSTNQSGIYCHYDSIINLKVRKLVGTDSIIFSKFNLLTFNEIPLKSTANDTSFRANTNIFPVGENAISVRLKNNLSGCSKHGLLPIKKVAKIGADFSISPTTPAGNIQFTDITTTATIKRNWSFGDGANDSITNTVSHQYASNATFFPSLIVKEINGCYDTAWKSVTISKVGIREMAKTDVKLYPIPAHSIIHVELPNNINKGVYNVTDVLGKTVLHNNIENNAFDIALEGLNKGSYIITFKTENDVLVRRFTIE